MLPSVYWQLIPYILFNASAIVLPMPMIERFISKYSSKKADLVG